MRNKPHRHGSEGFTLIELLVVTAILGILAVFASHALVGFASSVVDSSRDAAAATSPELSQAAKLVRLAGLAILLFGAGFWYTVEWRLPGRLDEFRLGHFLLLALTFSLFFIVFAVLDAQELSAWMAAGIAAGISYPLIVAHVSTIVGWRFAIGTALPLAALTTGIAINGVYGGDLRGLIFVAMLCVVVTFLTWTYPRMARGVDELRQSKQREVTRHSNALGQLALELRSEMAHVHALLRRADPIEGQGLRHWLEQRQEDAGRTIEDFDRLNSIHNRMNYVASRRSKNDACQSGYDLAIELAQKMPQAQAALHKAMQSLLSHRELAELPTSEAGPHHHCLACGHQALADPLFCSHCGRHSAQRRQCHRCAHVLLLPLHLLPEASEGLAAVTHCQSCGERHANAG